MVPRSSMLSLVLPRMLHRLCCFFFFNDTATTEIYTLSLHDALPISAPERVNSCFATSRMCSRLRCASARGFRRSEEHTSELQSQSNLVCRLLLEKKKKYKLPCLVLINNYSHPFIPDDAHQRVSTRNQ